MLQKHEAKLSSGNNSPSVLGCYEIFPMLPCLFHSHIVQFLSHFMIRNHGLTVTGQFEEMLSQLDSTSTRERHLKVCLTLPAT